MMSLARWSSGALAGRACELLAERLYLGASDVDLGFLGLVLLLDVVDGALAFIGGTIACSKAMIAILAGMAWGGGATAGAVGGGRRGSGSGLSRKGGGSEASGQGENKGALHCGV